MRRSHFPSQRRTSRLPIVLVILLVLIVGGAFYLASLDTEVPTQRIEQDVTSEALAKK